MLEVQPEKTTRMKPYSDDLRAVLCELAAGASLDEIVQITSLKKRTLERFISTVKNSGQLREIPTGKRGRPSVIDNDCAAVNESLFSV